MASGASAFANGYNRMARMDGADPQPILGGERVLVRSLTERQNICLPDLKDSTRCTAQVPRTQEVREFVRLATSHDVLTRWSDVAALIANSVLDAWLIIEARRFGAEGLGSSRDDEARCSLRGWKGSSGSSKRPKPSDVPDGVLAEVNKSLLALRWTPLEILFFDRLGFSAFCETVGPETTIKGLQTIARRSVF